MVSIQFIGSGDAFGSGGRFQTCICLTHPSGSLLIDCGASSLVALKRAEVAPASIDAILLSHLHGDHFGGVPFFILDAQFTGRRRPLVIAGPPGAAGRLFETMETLFPGSSRSEKRFPVELLELGREPTRVCGTSVTALPVVHTPGAQAHGIRVEVDGRIVAYSGDTEWTETLATLADGADLFICESYSFDKRVRYHCDYQTLASHRAELRCKRMILTHLSEAVLARWDELTHQGAELAADGLTINL